MFKHFEQEHVGGRAEPQYPYIRLSVISIAVPTGCIRQSQFDGVILNFALNLLLVDIVRNGKGNESDP